MLSVEKLFEKMIVLKKIIILSLVNEADTGSE